MPSGIFRLNSNDLIKGVVMAVIGAVVTYLSSPTVDLASVDWGYVVKTALIVAISYLAKNFVTDSEGKVVGKF
jgi:hypothetical protein